MATTEQLNWILEIQSNALGEIQKIGNTLDNIAKKLGVVDTGFSDTNKELKDLGKVGQESLSNIDKEVGHVNKSFTQSFEKITRLNQAMEVMDRISNALSGITQEVPQLKKQIDLYLDGTGENATKATASVSGLAAKYGESSEEIARAANVTAKEMGLSFSGALELIDKGFARGANLNGDYLEQLKEYPAQMKEAGLTAQEMTALISQAGKDGIYSDKALDTIKEAGMSLREMGQVQIEALAGIGMSVKDLAGKTTFEAVQMISKGMEGATTQAKQLVIADIFKGAGENAGRKFIEGLASAEMNLDSMMDTTTWYQNIQKIGGVIKGHLGSAIGVFANGMATVLQYAGNISIALPVLQGMYTWMKNLSIVTKVATFWQRMYNASAMGIRKVVQFVKSLTKAQTYLSAANKVVAVTQGVINAVMTANPIMLIVSGVILAITAIIYWWDELKSYLIGFVEFSLKYLNPFGWLYTLIDFVFPEVGQAIRDFFSGIWNWIKGMWEKIVGLFSGVVDWFSEDKEVQVTAKKEGETAPLLEYNKQTEENSKQALVTTSAKSNIHNGAKISDNGSSVGGGIKSTNVTIDNLIKGDIVINTTKVGESAEKIKQYVLEALVGGVRNFETT